ncbi:hypothetical protein LNP05_28455 [Klebsiella pneumoniae subsp. pneumoniae]|nr:hypothetical protein [Klebsiella pneumoniae subsp. pneumoniae]
MLYPRESRCIFITKGAGVQGLQNGAVSCIGMTGAVPSGIRAVLAENLIASMLDLEVASANDQTFSHSDIPPHRAHPDADAAGHRLYFLRLQRGAELRQHVRRLELRCGRF